MFANTFQSGFISIFYSVGSSPLHLWDKQVKNGHIRRVVDDEVRSLVLEISGTNVATTYITCPIKPRLSLGIKLPFLVMIIKNMKKYFTFEIQILDDKDMHRRFRVSNFQSTTKVRPFCTTMPIGLSSGWNQVQFNLADFTKRAYGSTYLETTRVQIHANVRIRRIYFSDILYSDDELPNEYKLFLPMPGTQTAARASKVERKESVTKEQRDSKKLSGSIALGEEIPSGALPSPVGFEEVEMPPPSEAPSEEPPTELMTETSEIVAEPPSEPVEGVTTEEATTTEPTEAPTDVPAATVEEEVFVEASDQIPEPGAERPPSQGVVEVPQEAAPETEMATETPAEGAVEPTFDEVPIAESTAIEPTFDEPIAESTPQEPPAEEVVDEAPAENPPEEVAEAEEPPAE